MSRSATPAMPRSGRSSTAVVDRLFLDSVAVDKGYRDTIEILEGAGIGPPPGYDGLISFDAECRAEPNYGHYARITRGEMTFRVAWRVTGVTQRDIIDHYRQEGVRDLRWSQHETSDWYRVLVEYEGRRPVTCEVEPCDGYTGGPPHQFGRRSMRSIADCVDEIERAQRTLQELIDGYEKA